MLSGTYLHVPLGGGIQFNRIYPSRSHTLLEEVYGYHLQHNYGNQMDGDIPDDTLYYNIWKHLETQSAIWYATLNVEVRLRFKACLAEEWRRFQDIIWNSDWNLVFSHATLMKKPGVFQEKEIRKRISKRIEILEEIRNVGLVGEHRPRDRQEKGGEGRKGGVWKGGTGAALPQNHDV